MRIKFRDFRAEDAPALINCIREEYGDSYFRENFYDAQSLIASHARGELKFFIAENDNELVGILAFEIGTAENVAELICGIILKKYRGNNISRDFFNHVVSAMKKLSVASICCYPVLYHDIVQKILTRLNFTACGFVFSEFLGALYLPDEHKSIAQKIYSQFNLPCTISTARNALTGKSQLTFQNDSKQQHCTIFVNNSGADLISEVQKIHARFDSELQTFNIFLNINDAKSIAAYSELIKLDYFFSGFKPLGKDFETMILHNSGNVAINFDSFILTEKFQELGEYVKKCYERRRN